MTTSNFKQSGALSAAQVECPAMPLESASLTVGEWTEARSAHEMNLLVAIRTMLEDFETGEAELIARALVQRFQQ